MKSQRKKFEEWIDSLTFEQLHSLEEQSAWVAWQAAIESVVVELPKNGPAVFLNDYAEGVVAGADIYKAAVEQALDKVGIKYE